MVRSALPMLLLAGCSPHVIDGVRLPDLEDVTFVEGVDHPFFPLPVGATWMYTGDTPEGFRTDEVQVLPTPREVNGVDAVVVYDVVYLDGAIAEESWDWYAQDAEGNVWYLGEDNCAFDDGDCVAHPGVWEWGVGDALPGVIMWADPDVDGEPYFQGYDEGTAEDVGEVLALDEDIDVAAGAFEGCVRTADTSNLEPGAYEQRVYCEGVGNVLVDREGALAELVSFTGL